MKVVKRFFTMFCTAGTMLFLGLDLSGIPPKQMIVITGVMCGIVNVLYYLLDGD